MTKKVVITMKIGAQLYTCTKFCQDLDGLAETLKKVADIGYKTVQLSGVCAYEADWMNEQLKKNGLEAIITHINATEVADKTDAVIEKHKKMGIKYIGIGGLLGLWNPDYNEKPKEYWANFATRFVPAAQKIKNAGCYFMYHNHHYEFMDKDGEILHDFLVRNFSPDIMGFTLDLYWVKEAGRDPVTMLNELKGRTPVVHFKDMAIMPDGEHRYASVGSGILDWDSIIKTCLDNGVEYAMVEQDNCYDEDPFVCLKKSYDFLTSKGLD